VEVLGFSTGAGQVAAGGGEVDGRLVGHSCAIDKSSQVACWGRDAEGQLGVGLGDDSAKPQVVLLARVFNASDQPTLDGIEQLDLGAFHTCAVGSQGSLNCWGDDGDQQLGSDLGLDQRDMQDMPDASRNLPGRAQRVRRFGSMR
jgi:alpha-tubulin suppressor-like RCC1 family protein